MRRGQRTFRSDSKEDLFVCLSRQPVIYSFGRWSSVSGRSSTVLEQAARQRYVSQFVDDLPATAEAHTVPAVIPRDYHVTLC